MVRKYRKTGTLIEKAAYRVSTGKVKFYFDVLDAIFFTIASTSFRSLSFRFTE